MYNPLLLLPCCCCCPVVVSLAVPYNLFINGLTALAAQGVSRDLCEGQSAWHHVAQCAVSQTNEGTVSLGLRV